MFELKRWHCTAALLAVVCLGGCGKQAADANLRAEVATLRQELDQVRKQAQRADDYIAISNLQRAYATTPTRRYGTKPRTCSRTMPRSRLPVVACSSATIACGNI